MPAATMIIGEAPGENEVLLKMPFVGASGNELSRMLQEVGLSREQCFVTNVCRIRPPKNDIENFISKRKTSPGAGWSQIGQLWVSTEISDGLAILEEEIALVSPNLIICFGNLALWAVTRKWGVKSWRGCVLRSCEQSTPVKVLCTYHPAAVLRQWSLRQTVVHDLQKAAREYLTPDFSDKPQTDFILRPTLDQLREVVDRICAQIENNYDAPLQIAPDIETRAGHIACFGFAWSRTEAICIPFMDSAHAEGYWPTVEEEVEAIALIQRLLTHPQIECVGQNWLYDAQYIYRHWHFRVLKVRDTMIAQHAMFSEGQKGLDYLSSLYNPDYTYWKDDGKKWDPSMGEEQLWEYNCQDCVETWIVADGQARARDDLAEAGWPEIHSVDAFQQRLFQPILNMMNRGVRPNLELKAKMGEQLLDAWNERQAWLDYVIGHPLNINSSVQMQAFFYDELQQTKNYKRGKPGEPMRPSCDDEALVKISEREPMLRPLIGKIQEMRSIGVFLSTFVNMRLDSDGRIRCSFNIAGTKTYRFSSSKSAFDSGTNLQNVPSGDKEEEDVVSTLPNVRRLFVPDRGYELFDIDLDSADLRIVTGESSCVGMQEYFAAGLKPYVEIAKEYHRDPSITKDHRSYKLFKALCHGTNYLGTPPGLASRIGLLVSEVDRIQKWYYGKFPEIKVWQDDLNAQIKGRGYIQNVFGYRFIFRERITEKSFNEGVAWIPQSSVGILINKILVNIDEQLPDVKLLLQVHDSLLGQYPMQKAPELKEAIRRVAQVELPYPNPFLIPIGIKTSTVSWGDCK
jgi:DNA polymerase I-like protein with 3'-5' exonuclease and polymerase domains/uracil-DNA glycosylase